MTDWNEMGEEGRRTTARVFEALETSGSLRETLRPDSVPSERPSPSALWAFAVGRAHHPTAELGAALLRDPALREDLASMLTRASVGEVPQVAAAATASSAVERAGRGFSLRLLPSRADPAHTYLLIRLEDPGQPVSRLVAMASDGATATLDLDAAAQDEIQMLCASNDPIIQAIADPEARIWLN